MTWQEQAACRGMDPAIFFGQGRTGVSLDPTRAIAVCRRCSAQVACLTAGRDGNESGVWGGVVMHGRGLSDRAAPACGTEAGWYRHRRVGQSPCDECKEARNRIQTERKARTLAS